MEKEKPQEHKTEIEKVEAHDQETNPEESAQHIHAKTLVLLTVRALHNSVL